MIQMRNLIVIKVDTTSSDLSGDNVNIGPNPSMAVFIDFVYDIHMRRDAEILGLGQLPRPRATATGSA